LDEKAHIPTFAGGSEYARQFKRRKRWHPFNAKRGLLTNRKPSAGELRRGAPILERMLELFRCETVIAMGLVAAAQLERIGRRATRVRHPANAGAALFRKQLRDALL
jgi:uracil-DNA glycosylase